VTTAPSCSSSWAWGGSLVRGCHLYLAITQDSQSTSLNFGSDLGYRTECKCTHTKKNQCRIGSDFRYSIIHRTECFGSEVSKHTFVELWYKRTFTYIL
jgi:hypothetical protein